MAKKVVKLVKLQIPAGKASPAPPVGPALGQAQVNIMGFCKEFNVLDLTFEFFFHSIRNQTFNFKTSSTSEL